MFISNNLTGNLEADKMVVVWKWRRIGMLAEGQPEAHSDPASVCLFTLNTSWRQPVLFLAAFLQLHHGVAARHRHRQYLCSYPCHSSFSPVCPY